MTTKIFSHIFVCLAIIPCVAYADTLMVIVEGIKPGQGTLRIAVFDEAHRDEFPEGSNLKGIVVPAAEEQMTVEIPDVEPGEYAIAVIQDLNENQKLDKKAFGIPKEPYGFSGAWKKGGASYKKASFNTEEDGYLVTIKLR